jgi:hypothetical protein
MCTYLCVSIVTLAIVKILKIDLSGSCSWGDLNYVNNQLKLEISEKAIGKNIFWHDVFKRLIIN